MPSRLSRLSLLLIVLALTRCGSADADDDGLDYRMGEPIADSTLALIVASETDADTLSAEAFQQQVQYALQQNPFAFSDEEQRQELRRQVAENFIIGHLLEREAERRAIGPDTAFVAQQLAGFLGQFPNEAVRDSILAAQGLTVDSIRIAIEEQARLRAVAQTLAEEAVEPTDEEIETYRQEQSAENEQIRAQHILFRVPEGGEDSVRTLAEAVLDSVQAGADFGTLAARYSADPGSGQRGGDLGFFGRGMMVPPFEEAAFALADSGDVAPQLVESQFGYHIIRLTGRQAGPLMPAEQAQGMLYGERQQEAFEEALEALRADVVIRVNPDVVEADLNEPLDEDEEIE